MFNLVGYLLIPFQKKCCLNMFFCYYPILYTGGVSLMEILRNISMFTSYIGFEVTSFFCFYVELRGGRIR